MPWDVKVGYAALVLCALSFVLLVLADPDLLLAIAWEVAVLFLAVVALVIATRFVFKCPRAQRAKVLALASLVCAGAFTWPPAKLAYLHLITRVYLAGGPQALNQWAQTIIRDHEELRGLCCIPSDERPPLVVTFLPGNAIVGQTIGSRLPQVNLELGGGFFHYGISVHPTGKGPEATLWKRVFGWPPEVVLYCEE
jgi:hypothetical protein